MGGILSKKTEWTLRELIESFKAAYCGDIGVEFMHITDPDQRKWVRDKFELRQYKDMSNYHKHLLLDRLYWTSGFSDFIAEKFNTMKRFGLEGCESLIPGMKAACDKIVDLGGQKVIIGMPHRGRLNILANVLRKPLETIFAEFQGATPIQDIFGINSGDVKYHMGTQYTRTYKDGKELTVEVLANPSHLECVNPVVMGKVRAENHYLKQEISGE